jgi:hypothetical protein
MAIALVLAAARPLGAAQPPLDYQPPPADPPATAQLSHPSSGQIGAPALAPPNPGTGAFQRLPAIDESRWVVLAVKQEPYFSFGQLDPVLTEACRLGDFLSLPLNRIIVRFSGPAGRAVAQVVPPLYRHLLIDRRHLARPRMTYYFFDTAWPDCEVRVEAGTPTRSFPAPGGTALPAFDPNALAKRKALIASWPKTAGR